MNKLGAWLWLTVLACAHTHADVEAQQTALQREDAALERKVIALATRVAALERPVKDLAAVPEQWLSKFGLKRWCTILHANSQRTLAQCAHDTEADCRRALENTSPDSDVLGADCVPRPAFVWCIRQEACFIEEKAANEPQSIGQMRTPKSACAGSSYPHGGFIPSAKYRRVSRTPNPGGVQQDRSSRHSRCSSRSTRSRSLDTSHTSTISMRGIPQWTLTRMHSQLYLRRRSVCRRRFLAIASSP